MRTLIETPVFQKQAAEIWTEAEYMDFTFWIACNPDAGDVIRETTPAARKVRWSRKGTGKSGGVRVIYYHLSEDGEILLLTLYAKAKHDTIAADKINKLRKNQEV